MGYLVDWFGYTHLVIGLLAAVYVPGFLAMRSAQFSVVVSLVVAPAITFVIVGVGGIVLDLLGIPWNLASFIVTSLLAVGLAYGLGKLADPGQVRRADVGILPATARRLAWSFGLALAFLILPILWIADPVTPSTQADPIFHYNGVNAVVETGSVSMITAMAPQYGIQTVNAVYPTVWHGLLALFGSGSIMAANHAFAYVVIPAMSLVSLVFFVRVALPAHPTAWIASPIVSLALPYFPNFLTVSRGFWPNSLALSVVPAILGLFVLIARYASAVRLKELGLTSLVALTALAGIGFAHPGAVFSALWPVLPTVLIVGGVAVVRAVRERDVPRVRGIAIGGLVAFLIGVTILLTQPRVASFLHRTHPRSWDTRERLDTLGQTLSGINPALIGLGAIAGIAVIALLVVAVRVAWRVPDARWIVIAWFAQWLLVVGAYVDGNLFSAIAGIWYHDPKRLMAVQVIFTAVIIALLVDRAAARLGEGGARYALAVGVVAISLAAGVATRAGSVYPDARPAIGPDRIIDSREEIALLRDLDDLVPPGSVIVGDATTGLGYAPAYSHANVVFPQVNGRGADIDGGYLRDHFHDIHFDPHVCNILSEYNIGYYYEDDPLIYQKRDRAETWPGLYGVDTSRDFTKIAETDGGTLWRIDACGHIGEPDWWDLDARFYPLPREIPSMEGYELD